MRHVILAAVAAATLAPASALAGTASLSLVRGSLTNVNDAAGIWQIEGGQVFAASGRQVGNYACTRRTVTIGTGGTSPQNTAMLTCTLFITGGNPPENVTIQGAHDYSSGGYIGSVSAASGGYAYLIGADVVGDTSSDTLTLNW
jgi:hypothetical protein